MIQWVSQTFTINFHKNINHDIFILRDFTALSVDTNFPRSGGTFASSKLLPADLDIFYSPSELDLKYSVLHCEQFSRKNTNHCHLTLRL